MNPAVRQAGTGKRDDAASGSRAGGRRARHGAGTGPEPRSASVPGPSGADARLVGSLRAKDLIPDDVTAVLSVGSLATGWANGRSDYDFYIVARSPWGGRTSSKVVLPLRPRTVPVMAAEVGGRRWDIKYWTTSQIDQLLRKVAWREFESSRVPARVLTEHEELFLERLATCVPLLGQGWAEKQRDVLETSAFRAIVTTRSLCEADDCAEDALGQLAAGDTDSAVLSARTAFGCVVDALLDSYGHYGSRTGKWRARRLRSAAPEELSFERYWRLETMAGFDAQDPAAWVIEVIRLCKRLALEIRI
jgi:hypothetical protein